MTTRSQSRKVRKRVLQHAIAAAVAAATAPSLLAAIDKSASSRDGVKMQRVPQNATMVLADGRKLLLSRQGNDWYAKVTDARGHILSHRATGQFQLQSGKPIAFDRQGRVVLGGVSTRGFLQCIDPPDCGG